MSARSAASVRVLVLALAGLGTGMVVLAAGGWFGLVPDRGPGFVVVALCKWSCLLLGALYAVLSARRAASIAWPLLATGIVCFWLAQSVLAYYQVLLQSEAPFPSWADPLFVIGMVALIAGTTVFLRDLAGSGLPLRMGQRLPRSLAIVAALGGPLSFLVSRPLLPIEKLDLPTLLGLFYPLSDLLLMVPVVLLLDVTASFRGGGIRTVWSRLLAGFALFLVADLLFAVSLASAGPWLVAIMDAGYVLSYALVALACLAQWRLSA